MANANNPALSTPPSTPPPPTSSSNQSSTSATFSIVPHYHNLLTTDTNLTPPIAAIESLTSLLSTSRLTTVSETLSLISTASTTLLASQRNPIPVSAGTDLFQRYLIGAFQNAPLQPSPSGSDFTYLRNQIITNSKVFVARAKNARGKIAGIALPLIRDGSVVVTYGGSRAVGSILSQAAEAGRWFRVVQILPSSSPPLSSSNNTISHDRITKQVASLRKAGVEVATVPLSGLSYILHSLPASDQDQSGGGGAPSRNVLCILGTSAVLENGAAVSEMGCYLVSQIMHAHSVPLYVATESYKFARQFPVGYGMRDLARMGTRQEVLRFTSSSSSGRGGGDGDGEEGDIDARETTSSAEARSDALLSSSSSSSSSSTHRGKIEGGSEQLIDITPPGLIAGLITENGMMTPNAVAEELIKLWF